MAAPWNALRAICGGDEVLITRLYGLPYTFDLLIDAIFETPCAAS
jgi:hypothetical protein